jgi:hypothetical protein
MRRFPLPIKLLDELGKPLIRRPVENVRHYPVAFTPELSVSVDIGKEAANAVEFNDDV